MNAQIKNWHLKTTVKKKLELLNYCPLYIKITFESKTPGGMAKNDPWRALI